MKALVIGSGKMGSIIAGDLVKDADVEAVGIVDSRKSSLDRMQKRVHSSKLIARVLDVTNTEDTKKLMKDYDVGVIALDDTKACYKVVEAAIEAGLNIVDILIYFRRPDPYEIEGLEIPNQMTTEEYGEWLHESAIAKDVLILNGLGFAPGISNITIGNGISKMDEAVSAIARVGGIPAKEVRGKYPLNYMITWAFEHVLDDYMTQAEVIKNGKVVRVPALSDRESFRFNKFGKDEEFECGVTCGMPSFIYTRPQLNEFAEKTIRWPGHYKAVDTLKECGMLDLTPIDFKGMKIAPRDFLSSVMSPKLTPLEADTDICIMWNTVTGIKNGQKMRIDYYMWEEADIMNGISAMGRVTGFPAAIGARLVGKGEIKKRGIVACEDAIEGEIYQKFMEELVKRNITILEVPETSQEQE